MNRQVNMLGKSGRGYIVALGNMKQEHPQASSSFIWFSNTPTDRVWYWAPVHLLFLGTLHVSSLKNRATCCPRLVPTGQVEAQPYTDGARLVMVWESRGSPPAATTVHFGSPQRCGTILPWGWMLFTSKKTGGGVKYIRM